MTRAEVRTFIKAGVDAMNPVLEFGSGLLSEFAAKSDKTLPQVWQELRPVEGTNTAGGVPIDEWDIRLHIAIGHNRQDIVSDDYEPVIDACDLVAQKLIAQYNFILAGNADPSLNYKLVALSERKREPFTKKFPNVMSGVLLTFTITAPDKTDVC